MAELKTRPTDASVPEFLASVENPRRRQDAEVLRELVTWAVATMRERYPAP